MIQFYHVRVSALVAILRILPISLALAGLTAADLGLPNETFWKDKTAWLYLCLVLAFFTSNASGALQELATKAEAAEASKFETQIRAAVAATAASVATLFGVGLDQVGVHVFLVSGPRFGLRWRLSRLVNVASHRIGSSPSMHRPRWTYGKGIVGRAWRSQSLEIKDWKSVYDSAISDGRQTWLSRDDEARFGLSWAELRETVGYRLIAARPIVSLHNGSTVIGCVAIDAQVAAPSSNHEIEEILATLCRFTAERHPPPRTWMSHRVNGY